MLYKWQICGDVQIVQTVHSNEKNNLLNNLRCMVYDNVENRMQSLNKFN